jgi:hypothetical protein
MLHHLFKSLGRAALQMAGAAGLALLFLLNVSWSLLPHRKPHPADMTLRATPVYPPVVVRARPEHAAVAQATPEPTPAVAAAVVKATPQPAPTPEPRQKHKPADMTLRAAAVGALLPARPKHAAVAQATPQPTPVPKPTPKPTPAVVAAVAKATPRPVPTPEPRRKRQPADMTLRAAAVGPLLPVRTKHPAVATVTDEEASVHADSTPKPDPTPPAAEEIRRLGVVRVIGAGGTFLLIEARDSDLIADIPNGTELRCRGSAETGGAQTALLRVSPERRAPFIVADIVSGSPQVGDGVYLPDAASPPR